MRECFSSQKRTMLGYPLPSIAQRLGRVEIRVKALLHTAVRQLNLFLRNDSVPLEHPEHEYARGRDFA